MTKSNFTRSKFIETTGAALGGSLFVGPAISKVSEKPKKLKRNGKMRVAVVGMGARGVSMYGRTLVEEYGDHLEMVGMCDTNPG